MESINKSVKITPSSPKVQAFLVLLLLVFGNQSFGQFSPLTQSQAMAEMERFGSGKRVLYMAAHPDDENTRLIAWLSNALDAETTYLSLTRGSGGQNLIGDELGAELGVIREHELRAARSVDGGNQRFTDALDFGYSKSVDEVWTKWDHDDLQLQAVRTIRELKPDFIITRFPPDERAGHGHHTASAELAIECAVLAADEKYDTATAAWSVQGVWWNTSVWWDPTLKDDPEAVYLDMSGFDPLLGDTYGAIGDAARSMHKCQGFGVPINRGPREEYFKKLWGGGDLSSYLMPDRGADAPSLLAQDAAFALEIGDQKQAIAKWAELGHVLLEQTTPESDKYQRWQQVMLHLLGVYAEVFTSINPIPEGPSYPATLVLQALNFDLEVKLASVKAPTKDMGLNPAQVLTSEGQELEVDLYDEGKIPKYIRVRLEHESAIIMLYLKPVAKLSDRAIGEYREAIAVEPAIHAKFDQTVYWNTGKKGTIGYSIYSKDGGELSWYLSASNELKLAWDQEESAMLNAGWNHFKVELPSKISNGIFNLNIGDVPPSPMGVAFKPSYPEKHTISYPHIGTHYMYTPAQSTLTVLDLNKKRIKVGYIEGAGDLMDETLESVDYEVVRITEETPELWDEVDAILVGIRAFNTEAWLMESEERIKSFVANGGNFVVTYTTAGRSGMALPLPVPLTIGRDRVTEEEAPVALKESVLMQRPNALSAADFEQWVQERGLYFPSEYEGYTTALSIAESTGTVYENSTVVASYGKGSVIYTGLSLFRELPKGVPGALRLLQNILHYDR
ncbi:PIG-L family deacetylase [Schleiferiaceae bacterium]|nr:PIG-L family deacetylase [Schleiferiaceae bacterium]MDC1224971.1 PIG-L family deacetylase [Schleiferiaceae bacterium]MDC1363697.1 PIG-L family deacetylase [Schleiferiaceae bacterium]MDC1493786.1 PIG-L family deacetylase [Schleiferiaceae bacterium]MDC1530232.1 PIG-L family deacetylase [Schleiferiaceae bacterium]